MAATVDGSIMQALFARLATVTLVPVLPIAWPNLVFTPPADHKFLRVQFIPNVNNRIFIGSNDPHQRLGLFQVSAYWPKGQGEAAIRDVAGKVAQHFPTDLRLIADVVEIRVTAAPEVADMIVEDLRVQIPVTIPYEAWA